MWYNVSLEINIEANSSLEAAKIVDGMVKDPLCNWQYYVQESEKSPVYSIDLQEEDEDAVIEIKDYKSIIET